jgi:hypothetical protein
VAIFTGRVVVATPCSITTPPERYICVAETAGKVWLIPVAGRIWSHSTKNVPITGPCAWEVVRSYESIHTFQDVVRKLEAFVALDDSFGPNRNMATAKDNLKAARLTLSELTMAKGTETHKLLDFAIVQPNVFSFSFAPPKSEPVNSTNYVGKLIFAETHDGTGSGEGIVIEQSEKYIYFVSTNCAYDGREVSRVALDELTILRAYDDDKFAREYVDRLRDFADLAADENEGALSTARMVERMLDRKEESRARLQAAIGVYRQMIDRLTRPHPASILSNCCCG